MSNLQDVPLAEPDNVATTDNETAGSKNNSLKRFFKLGKKSNSSQDHGEYVIEPEDEANKDTVKPGSISRFLTRFKGTAKTGNVQFAETTAEPPEPAEPTSNSSAVEELAGKPVPNSKPTLKTSISGYWKQLFHRQKAANRQGASPEQQLEPDAEQEIIELKQVQQEQQTDPITAEDGLTGTPATSHDNLKTIVPEKSLDIQSNCIPEILEEVQMLAVSDEMVDPSSEDQNKV